MLRDRVPAVLPGRSSDQHETGGGEGGGLSAVGGPHGAHSGVDACSATGACLGEEPPTLATLACTHSI